jgi:pilus assembly protein CpaC
MSTLTRFGHQKFLMLCFSLVAVLMVFSGQAYGAKGINTEVTVGKSSILTLPVPIERISIANPKIADVVVIKPNELQLNGLKVGTTSLIIWDKSGNKTFFELSVLNDNSQLMQRISELAPGDTVNVKVLKDSIILTGTVSSEERLKKIAEILKGAETNVVNLIEVADIPQVLLQITVASVDRNATRQLGINWIYAVTNSIGLFSGIGAGTSAITTLTNALNLPTTVVGVGTSTATSTSTPNGISGSTTTSINTTQPTFGVLDAHNNTTYLLRALSAKGLAKILAEPNLIVKSGEDGKFHAGGEFPVPVVTNIGGTGNNTVSIQFKPFGVTLNFKPVVKDSGVIQLKLDPAEVSAIDNSVAVISSGFNIPGVKTDTVSTSVDLKEGETFVVAGLINTEWSKNLSKIPILGDIPILGAFFREQAMNKTERELVFVVTPKLMKPMAPGQRAELPGMNEPTARQQEDLRWVPMMPNYRSMDAEQLK